MSNRIRSLIQSAWLNRFTTSVTDRLSPLDSLGKRGEREAERFLLRKGMVIIYRSFANQFGEIDLIAADGKTIVFVEVKTRSSDYAGRPDEAVDDRKQNQISQTALAFLRQNNLLESSARFDVVSIEWNESNSTCEITHFVNAFESTGNFQMLS